MKVAIKNNASSLVLKPCPFCGGWPEFTDNVWSGSGAVYWSASCFTCTMSITDCGSTLEDAQATWNSRVPTRDPDFLMYEAGQKLIGVNDVHATQTYKDAGIELTPVWTSEL